MSSIITLLGSWIVQHQVSVASVITLLVSSAWTPLIRKLPHTQWLWIIIRAVLAGVPKEPPQIAPQAKKEENLDEKTTGPIPPPPPAA
jgi:hypothetical protein